MMRRLWGQAGLDRPVMLGLAARAWTVFAGPVTLLVIASFLSLEEQGYYYTFAALLGLQSFIELGLGTVIIQFASHEWSELRLEPSGRITGSPEHLSRLLSLSRFSIRWYAIAAPVSAFGLAAAGFAFFSRSVGDAVVWQGPWLLLCLVSSANLLLLPVWSLLEGCNQIERVYLYRLLNGVVVSLATWGAMSAGGRLWSAPIAVATSLLLAAMYLLRFFSPFLGSLFARREGSSINWRRELLPLQWRIALSWLGGYFIYQITTPASFRLFGPAIAGQVGMTFGLASTVLITAYTWMATKTPQLGMLTAQGDRKALDALFMKTTARAFAAAIAGSLAVWIVTFWLYEMEHRLSTRLLGPRVTAVFLVGTTIAVLSWCMGAYARAHKAEPFLPITLLAAALSPVCLIVLGGRLGVIGVALAFLVVHTLQLAANAIVFVRFRRARHLAFQSAQPGTNVLAS